jgi:hypothetical protein
MHFKENKCNNLKKYCSFLIIYHRKISKTYSCRIAFIFNLKDCILKNKLLSFFLTINSVIWHIFLFRLDRDCIFDRRLEFNSTIKLNWSHSFLKYCISFWYINDLLRKWNDIFIINVTLSYLKIVFDPLNFIRPFQRFIEEYAIEPNLFLFFMLHGNCLDFFHIPTFSKASKSSITLF